MSEEWGVYSGHATIHRWLTELCDEVDRLNESLDNAFSAAEEELRHRQEQVVEARRIAALCYEARVGDPSAVDAAIEAWLNRSWKGEL